MNGRTGALAVAAVAATIAALPFAALPIAMLSNPAMANPPVDLPAAILERYTGYYALSASSVITVTRAGSQLLVQLPGQPAAEIYAETPASFLFKTMDVRIDFMPNPPVEITALVLHQQGLDHVSPRIDAAQAQAIAAANDQRAKAGTP
jgi:bla regulator protein blaR1